MKKSIVLLSAILAVTFGQIVFATQLPADIKNYVIQNVPNTTVRFDGLVTLPDGTLYLPLIPAYDVKGANFGVKYTYPANKTFKQKPEIIIFNNNYCMLKLIKTKTGYTVTSLQDLPIEVRSGILPQDLLVPKGLVLPDTLIGILGDLNIPLKSNLQIDEAKKKSQNTTLVKEKSGIAKKINVVAPLQNKQFFITNFNSNYIYIMPSDMKDVQYTLKLDSIPKVVKGIGSKFLLVATNGKTYIDVVDVQNEEIAKQIDIGVEVDEIVVTSDEKSAYIVSNHSPNLYVVDIPTMTLTKQIQIKGMPEKLNLSDDETKLIYQDSMTADIYTVEINNEYVNIYQCNVPNTSKVAVVNNKVYALSRTRNALRFFPYQEYVVEQKPEDQEVMGSKKSYYIKSSLIATGSATKNFFKKQKEEHDKLTYVENGEVVQTSNKPVDMLFYNGKLYILSATTNSIDVFNPQTKEVEKTIPLRVAGFSNKFNRIEDTGLVLITNVADKNYVVFDLNGQKVLQINPIDIQMTTLTVVDKTRVNKNVENKTQGQELEKIEADNKIEDLIPKESL